MSTTLTVLWLGLTLFVGQLSSANPSVSGIYATEADCLSAQKKGLEAIAGKPDADKVQSTCIPTLFLNPHTTPPMRSEKDT